MGALRYTAQGGQGQVPSTPVRVYESAEAEEGIRLGRDIGAITTAGMQLNRLGREMQDQADRTELFKMRGLHDGMVAQAQLDAERDPEVIADPSQYERVYGQKIEDSNKKLLDSATNDTVRNTFDNYIQGTQPELMVKAQAHGLKLQGAKWQGDMINVGNMNAAIAAREEPTTRNSYRQQYQQLVDWGQEKGFIQPAQAEKLKQGFDQKVLEENAKFWRYADPAAFQEFKKAGAWKDLDAQKFAGIMSEADAADRAREERLDKENKKMVDEVKQVWLSDATQGIVDQKRIDRGLQRMDPVIKDVEYWEKVDRVNKHAKSTNGDPSVESLMAEYRNGLGSVSFDKRLAYTEGYLKAAGELGLDLGAPNDKLMKFIDHLDSNVRSMRATERAEATALRAVKAQESAAGDKIFTEGFDAEMSQRHSNNPSTQARRAQEDKQDRAQGRLDTYQLIQKGLMKPEDAASTALDKIRQRRKEQRGNAPTPQSGVNADGLNQLYGPR